jgi:UDP-N-acetylmuramoyl-L-alanyl-D-glutamate--2,6-diaminopimelate ligase
VVNVDGQKSEAVLDAVAARGDVTLLRCSTQREDVELYLKNVRCDIAGLTATLVTKGQSHDIRSPLLGAYNADNLLLAIGCALAIGVTPETACEVAGRLVGVPGRLERVDQSRELAVLVDYAHTPDALSRALTVLAPLVQNRLICVFGCGGDRDRKKRPLMGRAVAELADVAIVTSDNPRSEDPQAIIDEILPGIEKTARLSRSEQLAVGDTRCYAVIKDRAQAIARSVELLQAGDILLIAGKGHEDYQILGKRRIHFDDREHAKAALSSRGL